MAMEPTVNPRLPAPNSNYSAQTSTVTSPLPIAPPLPDIEEKIQADGAEVEARGQIGPNVEGRVGGTSTTIHANNSQVSGHVGPNIAGRDLTVVYNFGPAPTPSDASSQPTVTVLQRLQNSLRAHYSNYTHLKRLFGETETRIAESFINLALIKEAEHKTKEQGLARALKEKDDEKTEAGERQRPRDYIDERMASHEQLYAVKEPLALTELFEAKDDTKTPNKILILGRAGIGKSVLCQYLATQWACKSESKGEQPVGGYLRQKFEAVFWLKLRELADKIKASDKLANVINDFCLQGLKKDKPTQKELASYIEEHTSKILFILDGYDEITDRIDQPAYAHLSLLLGEFTVHQNILLTSRPLVIDTLGNRRIQFDRRLENMGFLNENIQAYVEKFMQGTKSPEKATPMLQFLKSHPGVWGIAHTPINLELLSWLWSKGELAFTQGEIVTLSKLYQTIVNCVQAAYTRKTSKRPAALALDDHMETKREVSIVANRVNEFLERLAYRAMEKETLFIPPPHLKIALEKTLARYQNPDDEHHQEQLLKSATDKLGFLRAAGQKAESQLDQDHYFIHLSFQEFYAAKYIVRIFNEQPDSEEAEAIFQFICREKYTSRYQLTFWMSAGLLYQYAKRQNFNDPPRLSLERFWHAILSLPRDLIGFYHAVLAMHCLDECEADDRIPLHQTLIEQQLAWLKRNAYERRHIEQLTRCFVLLNSKSVVDSFLVNLQNNNEETRNIAVEVLSKLNAPSEYVISNLIEILRNEDKHIRITGIEILGNLANLNNNVIAALLKAGEDHNVYVRHAAGKALEKLKNPSDDVVKKLNQLEWGSSEDRDEWQQCHEDELDEWEEQHKYDLLCAEVDAERAAEHSRTDAIYKLDWNNLYDIPAILRTLENDKDSYIVLTTLDKLNKLSDEAVPILLPELNSKNKNVRAAIATALGKLNTPSDDIVTVLLNTLKDEYVRNKAFCALGGLPHPRNAATEAMRSMLEDRNESARNIAFRRLRELKHPGDVVIFTLLNALKNEDIHIKKSAIETLGNLNRLTDMIMTALTDTLKDEDESVKQCAVRALWNLSKNSPNEIVISILTHALKDKHESVRALAACALLDWDKNNSNEAMIEILLGELKNKNGYTEVIVSTLCKLNHPSGDVITALRGVLNDIYISLEEAITLGRLNISNDTVTTILLDASCYGEDWKRDTASRMLRQLASQNGSVVSKLLQVIYDDFPGPYKVTAAIYALSEVDDLNDYIVTALLGILSSSRYIGWSDKGETSAMFGRGNAHAAAVYVLGRLRHSRDDVIAALFNILRNGMYEEVRCAAVYALGRLSHFREDLIAILLKTLNDGYPEVRCAAIRMLAQSNNLNGSMIVQLMGMVLYSDYSTQHEARQDLPLLESKRYMQMVFEHLSAKATNFKDYELFIRVCRKLDYLLCVDHTQGCVIVRPRHQTYYIPLSRKRLIYLEIMHAVQNQTANNNLFKNDGGYKNQLRSYAYTLAGFFSPPNPKPKTPQQPVTTIAEEKENTSRKTICERWCSVM